ncbi:hypothetical protein [Saccharothrix sp. HUAS TT1]|uniref:hypothetical protein n=1 Tax=unclassified Saccharothrix TaxID=2593673 RepID=UPI00345B6D3A
MNDTTTRPVSVRSAARRPAEHEAVWPRPSRPTSQDPSVRQLLAMAEGRKKDWRPTEPTDRELLELDREVRTLLASYARDTLTVIDELTAARTGAGGVEPSAAELAAWDALGHLATGS